MPLALALVLAAGLQAAPALRLPPPQPATIQGAVQYDMPSKIAGRTYRLYVYAPQGPAPTGGWPVVYVMDGDAAFPVARFQMAERDGPDHRRALLVGIGYAGASRGQVTGLRVRDLTPSRPDDETLLIGGFQPGQGEFAGAETMLRVIDEEVQPSLAAVYPIDASDRALVGYSLGGLFALHTLFTHPKAFRTVVIGSPSIWWNHREVLKDEPAFAQAVTSGAVSPRVLITSDGLEQTPQGVGAPDTPEARGFVARAAMIDNARALATRLEALHGGPGYSVRYVLFDGEGHNTGTAAAMSRAINFVLEK